ncbi:MAG: phosphotransferase [Alphaproteobacteria bacterium GM7ARS4]|nr:phosphotransferase [Alphaproteobacteria bacterium GM7ARS4]
MVQKAFVDFVCQQGWASPTLERLAGDASGRRYWRVRGGVGGGGESRDDVSSLPLVLLVHAPPPEDVGTFFRAGHYLRSVGLRTPHVYVYDFSRHLALIEDFGEKNVYGMLLRGGRAGRKRMLYECAIDVLATLHSRSKGDKQALFLPPYDMEALQREHRLFVDWYVSACGVTLREKDKQNFLDRWRMLLDPVVRGLEETGAWVVTLRDFHADNIMFLADELPPRCCGLLDFQDAVRGSVAYDVVSLLYDVRVPQDSAMRHAMMERYMASLPEGERETFLHHCALFNSQRLCKIAGIFMRLAMRDKKEGYQHYMPRVMALLEDSLEHASVASIKEWFERYLPRDKRLFHKELVGEGDG